MKNKKYLCLSLIALLSLASCQKKEPSASKPSAVPSVPSAAKPSDVSSRPSVTPSVPGSSIKSDVTTIIDVAKSYALTVEKDDGCDVVLDEQNEDGKYEAGSEVSFTLVLSSDTLAVEKVTVNDLELVEDSPLSYSFTMPNQDSVLKVTTRAMGDQDVLLVDDVDEAAVPTLESDKYLDKDAVIAYANSLKKYLALSSTAEMDHMSYATYHSTGFDLIGKLFSTSDYSSSSTTFSDSNVDIRIDALSDNALRFVANKRGSYADSTKYASFERGLYQNGYYERYSEVSSNASTQSDETLFYDIVDDDAENFSDKVQIKSSNSTFLSSAVGFGDKLSDKFLKESGSYSLNYTDYRGNMTNFIKKAEANVAPDKKSVDFDIYFLNTSFSKTFEYKITVDGNGMITHADYTAMKYSSMDVDKENKELVSGAVGTLDDSFSLDVYRGFKSSERKTDISKYAMKDYDLVLETKLEGQSSKMVRDLKVENSSVIQGFYPAPAEGEADRDYHGLIAPVFVSTGPGEEDFLENTDDGKYLVKKEGTFHLVFDNRFGEKKTFEVTSVQPEPYSVSCDLPSGIYVGNDTKFSASVSPDGADQSVTAKILEGDTTGSVLTDNGDGTFTIKAASEGEGMVEIASKKNPDIKKQFRFKAYQMPDIDTLKENLKNKTLKGITTRAGYYSDYNYDGFINFNPDATGLSGSADFRLQSSQYSKQTMTFEWTLDPQTFAFTLTQQKQLYYMTFKSLTVLGNDTMTVTFDYDGDVVSSNYTFADKVELN